MFPDPRQAAFGSALSMPQFFGDCATGRNDRGLFHFKVPKAKILEILFAKIWKR
jgi:hypothetical protein